MEKYWKLTIFTVGIIAVLATLLWSNTKLTAQYPQFTIETIEGNAENAKPLTVTGTMDLSMFSMEDFEVTMENGTTYDYDKSFFDRMIETSYTKESQDMVKNYRSFMRGKDSYEAYYFENEQYLVYVNPSSSYLDYQPSDFEIDILNKETKEQITNTVPIPNRSDLWYADVESVMMVDNQIHIITDNGGDDGEFLDQYVYDMDAKEIISNHSFGQINGPDSDNGYSNTSFFENMTDSKEILVAEEWIEIIEDANMDYSEEKELTSLHFYNLETNQQSEIKLPGNARDIIGFDDDWVYYISGKAGTFTIEKYHREQEKVVEKLNIDIVDSIVTGGEDLVSVVKENKAYISLISYEERQPVKVSVIDLANMKVDYVGEVVDKEKKTTDKEDQWYYFTDIEVN